MNVMITGVTGTLGKFILPYLEKDPKIEKIIGISRDEFKQSQIPKYSKLILKIADIRDRDIIIDLSRKTDIIFHFAALKRIDTIEENPYEAIHTNILGTYNILNAQIFNKINRIVFCSTDKAVLPINVYGATKFIGERIILSRGNNVVVRWSNIMGSRGSVIPYFIESLKNKREVTLTSDDMTRFFIKLEDAVPFMLSKAFFGKKGLYIPIDYMRRVKITDIIHSLAKLLNIPQKDIELKKIPIRKGEKFIEDMVSYYEPDLHKYNTSIEYEDIHDGCIKDYTLEELQKDLKKYI